jgi:RNA polymerase sigma factor (TIGR02999 family)
MDETITQALAELSAGEEDGLKRLYEVSYPELKRLAHSRLYAANMGAAMSTQSLLHESFMHLAKQNELHLPDRKRFFAYASKVMHHIILDSIREANAQRRGSGEAPVTLSTDLAGVCEDANDTEAVSNAMKDLERIDPALARLVEMKFFGGLTELEIAQALGVSERTVRREWDKARAALVVLLEA